MSRVELLPADQAPLPARRHYGADGSASPITRALAQVPELLDVTVPFVGRVLGETSIDAPTKELVILRVSAVNGCRYCVETHTVAAWDAGLDPARTEKLRAQHPGGLSAREAALVAWCDAVCATPAEVPQETAATLREHFAEHEMVELTLVAATTLMLNRFCTALGLPTPPGTRARLEAGR